MPNAFPWNAAGCWLLEAAFLKCVEHEKIDILGIKSKCNCMASPGMQ